MQEYDPNTLRTLIAQCEREKGAIVATGAEQKQKIAEEDVSVLFPILLEAIADLAKSGRSSAGIALRACEEDMVGEKDDPYKIERKTYEPVGVGKVLLDKFTTKDEVPRVSVEKIQLVPSRVRGESAPSFKIPFIEVVWQRPSERDGVPSDSYWEPGVFLQISTPLIYWSVSYKNGVKKFSVRVNGKIYEEHKESEA